MCRQDLVAVANNYGKKRDAAGKLPRGDVNADGIVNRKDLVLVAELVEVVIGVPAAPMLRQLRLRTWADVKQP